MNSQRKELAREITQHLQSTFERDIDFVYDWLASEGYDADTPATELVMYFSERNELPSQKATQ